MSSIDRTYVSTATSSTATTMTEAGSGGTRSSSSSFSTSSGSQLSQSTEADFTLCESDDLSDDDAEDAASSSKAGRSWSWLRRKTKSPKSAGSEGDATAVGLYPSALATEPKHSSPSMLGLLSQLSIKAPRSRAQADEAGFYFACNLSELPIKKGAKIKLNKRTLAVFRLADGTVYAMENSCSHQRAPLACGTLMDIEDVPHVKCPGHNVKFNLKTGSSNRGKWQQKVYETLIKREELWIRV